MQKAARAAEPGQDDRVFENAIHPVILSRDNFNSDSGFKKTDEKGDKSWKRNRRMNKRNCTCKSTICAAKRGSGRRAIGSSRTILRRLLRRPCALPRR